MVRMLATFTLLALACGGSPLAVKVHPAPDAQGLMPDWVYDPLLTERTRGAVAIMARGWGGDASAADGWTLYISSAPVECEGVAVGCTDHRFHEVYVTPWSARCVEETTLGHEIGHVVIGDHRHADERWHDRAFWDRMFTALRANLPAAEPGCLEDAAYFAEHNEVHGEEREESAKTEVLSPRPAA
ncbi:MAG TPA: hypothetical protein VEM76_05255 [Anaeromyxobacteraceae bacterium]|nr:hypothetical protein [Anaeromyxobacteraceae bacterium]